MSKSKRKIQERKIRPTFWVFCEGESEKVYVEFLRSLFRVPIQLKCSVSHNDITRKYIDNYKKGKPTSGKDRDYVMFDIDVAGILDKLQQITNVTLLCSNPCVELWFLLHYQNNTKELNTESCCNELLKHCPTYKKAQLHPTLCEKLKMVDVAVLRAKNMQEYKNPSSSIYKLIEELQRVKSEK